MKLARKNIDEIISRPEMPQFRDHVVFGLYLKIHPTDKKSWYSGSSAKGKEKVVYLGKYPKIDLRAALKIAQIQFKEIYINIVSASFSKGNSHLIDEQNELKLRRLLGTRHCEI